MMRSRSPFVVRGPRTVQNELGSMHGADRADGLYSYSLQYVQPHNYIMRVFRQGLVKMSLPSTVN